MKYILTLGFLFCSSFIFCQDSGPALSLGNINIEDDRYAAKSVKSKLTSRLKKDFSITEGAFFVLTTNATFGKMHVINGMDSYTTSEVVMTYKIDAEGVQSEDIDLVIKCKGKSEKDLKSKLGTSIIRDSKHYEKLEMFINSFMEKSLTNCSTVSTIVQKQLDENDYIKAYSLLSYYDMIQTCESEKEKMEEAIVNSHTEYACASIIQEAEILANSGNEYKMDKAINKLLLIPPNASCAKEAIRIAELVNKNALELGKTKATKMNDRIVIRNTMTQEDWRIWYRENYRKY